MKRNTLSLAILAALLSSTSSITQAAQDFDTIVVSANNTPQTLKSVTGSTFVVTQQDIEEKQYQTIEQALQRVPGLNFYNYGGPLQSNNIQMRGSSSGQVLVMVDGIAINDPSAFGANINSVALQDVERIEVIKGPQAGVWGANAASGVINIITKKAKSGTHGQVNVEAGSNNTQKLAASLSSANEQGDFSFSMANVSSDGFSTIIPVNGDSVEKDAYSQTDFNLKLGINLNKEHRLESFIKNSTTSADYDSGDYDAVFNYIVDPNDSISNSEMDSQLRKLQYLYTKDNFNMRVYLSQFEIERTAQEPTVNSYYEGKITEKGAIASYEYLENQSLTAGATLTDTHGLSDYFGITSSKYKSTGLFISNSNQFNNNSFILTESLRKDRYDNDFKDKVTGKVGFKNYFNDEVYVGAQYGTAYNAPSVYEIVHPMPGGSVQPQTTKSYEVNLGAYGLEISYYNNDITNLITYNVLNPDPNAFEFAYSNESGVSTLKGIEISYARYFEALNTDFYLAYDKLSAKDSTGQWLGRRPESQVSLNISYDGFDKTLLGIETRYIGQMYDGNNQKGAQIGKYTTTNLTASYAVNSHLDVYGRLVNVFNSDYATSVADYQADGVTPKYIYNNGGRQFFIGIRGKL